VIDGAAVVGVVVCAIIPNGKANNATSVKTSNLFIGISYRVLRDRFTSRQRFMFYG
jgi:hypothetical protein